MERSETAAPPAIPHLGMRSPQRIGRALSDARAAAGMQQADVAAASGISRETISALEGGARNVRVSTLVAVLRAVGYEVAFLPISPPAASAAPATDPTRPRVVLCGAETATGTCRRRLVSRPCPLHPASPGSQTIRARTAEH